MHKKPKPNKRTALYTAAIVWATYMLIGRIFGGFGNFIAVVILAAAGYNLLKPFLKPFLKSFVEQRTMGWTADEARRSAAADARASFRTASRSESAQSPFAGARSERVYTPTPASTPTPAPPPAPAQPIRAEAPARPAASPPERKKPEYPPEVQKVVEQGEAARKELSRLYAVIPDIAVKRKVQELLDVAGKIIDDAKEDPTDVPQIQKFLDYYLPTTIKLLKSYERMSAQGISGENISKSMENIREMLDTTVDAYKKLLDSLFANQALDIETDIQVMNTLLKREGFSASSGGSPFQVEAR